MDKLPFVYKFRNNGRHYIYDVNTNNILKTDECLYDIIDEFNYKNHEEVVNKFRNKYPLNKIKKCFDEINSKRKSSGMFSNERPKKMFFPFNKKEIKLILDNLMSHVILNVTEDCNLRCEYCKYSGLYKYARSHDKKYMKEEIAYKAIEYTLNRSNYIIKNTDENCYVGFYGGEPLTNFKLIKKSVDFTKKNFAQIINKVKFSMTTNLTVLTDEILDFLVENDISILVSLDGPLEIHDRYRKYKSGKGTFEKISGNLKKIRERSYDYYNRKVGFSVVLAPPFNIPVILNFFENNVVRTDRPFFLSYVDPQDTTFFDRFDNYKEINKELLNQLNILREEYKKLMINMDYDNFRASFLETIFSSNLKDIFRRYLIKCPEKIFPNGICLPGFQKVLVGPDGNFFVCEKIGYSFPIGDVFNGFNIDAIWNLIQKYIKLSEPMCLDCWAVRLCKSCYLRAQRGDQLDIERKMENCSVIKSSFDRGLKLFCEIMEENPNSLSFYKDIKIEGGLGPAFQFINDYYNGRNKRS
ncbi:MAG: radical SAM protein [Candidatus Aminicenantes bacterium]|nr:radical SAM protein [Candidatus Aminicenantes bacterium]